MGLVIDADENDQKVVVEIRRESVAIYSTEKDWMFCDENRVEMDKDYLRRIVEFFNKHPEHLVVSG